MTRSLVLTDVASGVYLDRLDWSQDSSPAADGSPTKLAATDRWSITKRRLRGGVSDGVDVVELDNGLVSVAVLPTRGMGLWRARAEGTRFGWDSPVTQPVHPAFVNQAERGGLGWLNGFNELLCRCGLSWFGPPTIDRVRNAKGEVVSETSLTLHGRIANIPAHRVTVEVDDAGEGALRVVGEVDETSLFGPCLRLRSTVELEAGSRTIKVRDEVTNLADLPGELSLLYHINVGSPVLEGGARVAAAAKQLAPRDDHAATSLREWNVYLPPTPGFREQCYFLDPAVDGDGRSTALLRNAAGTLGFSVRFDPRELPWFTVWKNTIGARDGYVTGLEPGTALPNPKSFERDQGRVLSLAPGATYVMNIELGLHTSADAVRAVESSIEAVARTVSPRIHPSPVKEWTA